MKIRRRDLRLIASKAKENYVNLSHNGLEDDEFKVKCWIEAVSTVLRLDLKVRYPETVIIDVED